VDTEIRCFAEQEVDDGTTSVQSGVEVEAVKLVRERGVSLAQASRDLDLHVNMLRKWVRDHEAYAGSRPCG